MTDDLALALEIADVADGISMERFRAHDLKIDAKPDLSPVTEADRAIETYARERLATERPSHAILGEEFGLVGDRGATWRWVIDPIDGTRSFVRGQRDLGDADRPAARRRVGGGCRIGAGDAAALPRDARRRRLPQRTQDPRFEDRRTSPKRSSPTPRSAAS